MQITGSPIMLVHLIGGLLPVQPRGAAITTRMLSGAGGGPPTAGRPPIEVLAERQRMATLLHENWNAAAELVGDIAGADVRCDVSDLHGVGVFAQCDLPAGQFVTLYPVHRLLQTTEDGRAVGALADEEDEAYFLAADLAPDERVYRQVAYRQTYAHPSPDRHESFQMDANANKPDVTGWVGHRLNDGATLSPSDDAEEALLAYYERSAERRNVCPVSLCVPLLGFVTTRPVKAGEELLATCSWR